MDSCCENKAGELGQLRVKQGRVLYIVLAINAVMFLVEFVAGWVANSTALLGDSLDMFGDASVYALTLFVLHRSVHARAGAALFKGGLMLLFGLLVVADALRKLIMQEAPSAGWMGVIGVLALIANGYCFVLLYSHRSDDLNMRSTWLCSRNDLLANSSVIVAAGLVALTASVWPDILVGIAIAALFIHSAVGVIREAWTAWRSSAPQPLLAVSCCARKTDDLVPLIGIAEPGSTAVQPPVAKVCCAHDLQAPKDACCTQPLVRASEGSHYR
ncbi:cation transporter [Pseudomonas sp. Marseille-QA0892]